MKHTIGDAVRMVGHLLEHHGTTGAYARDKYGEIVGSTEPGAASFCAVGACGIVVRTLGLRASFCFNEVTREVKSIIGSNCLSFDWDQASPSERIEALADFRVTRGDYVRVSYVDI